jgi:hypothetical protein
LQLIAQGQEMRSFSSPALFETLVVNYVPLSCDTPGATKRVIAQTSCVLLWIVSLYWSNCPNQYAEIKDLISLRLIRLERFVDICHVLYLSGNPQLASMLLRLFGGFR